MWKVQSGGADAHYSAGNGGAPPSEGAWLTSRLLVEDADVLRHAMRDLRSASDGVLEMDALTNSANSKTFTPPST